MASAGQRQRLTRFQVPWTLLGALWAALFCCVNSEPTFIVETSELCASTTAPTGLDLQDNVHLSGVYRYHNETNQCYRVGDKGPCGELMIFYADPTNSDYGECDCDQEFRCHRPLIYWPQQKRCYLALEQGPCESNEWLTMDYFNRHARCQQNPCNTISNNTSEFNDEEGQSQPQGSPLDYPEPTSTFWFHSHETGECYKTNTQGPCHFPNEVVVFNGFEQKIRPSCTTIQTQCILPEVPTLFCAPGQKWSIVGHCDVKPRCTRHRKGKGKTPFYRFHHDHGRQGGRHRGGRGSRHSPNRLFQDHNTQNKSNTTDPTQTYVNSDVWDRWSDPNGGGGGGFLPRRYQHLHHNHHHHHFHNHSSVGPQWKRNNHFKRTSIRANGPPRSRTNSNYIEVDRVDFRNNGDEYDTELASSTSTSSEKK